MKYLSYLFVLTALLWSNKSIAYDIEVDGFYYNVLSATTLEVTYGDKKYSGDVTIPSTVSYSGKTFNVVSVGTKAFAECDKLLSIYMGKNIKSIGNKAFYKCSSLKNYYFSNCELGSYVFAYCTSLISGDIKGNIPAGTFYGCTSIESLSPKYRSIGKKAYEGCSSIKGTVEIVGSTYDVIIYESAFADCIGITKVSLKANVKMELDAFAGCSSLETVYASNNDSDSEYTYVSGFGPAFGKCKNLKNVEIEKFGKKIFCEDGSIYAKSDWGYYLNFVIPDKSVYITPDWLPYINNYSFSSIGKLRRVILSANLKSIDINAFYNCPDLKEIYCYSKTPISINELYEQNIIADFNPALTGKLKLYVPKGCKQNYSNRRPWSNFIIEEFDVASFDPYAEYEEIEEVDGIKYKITSDTEVEVVHKDDYSGDIVIPETVSINDKEYKVTSIGKDAFYYTQISAITIPEGITKIEDRAFMGCSMLKTIELANSIIEIGENAFCSCSELESVKLPHNLRKIGPGSFYYCGKLKKIVIPEMIERICAFTFRSCHDLETVIIPNKVTSIGDVAFADCWNLKTVVLGEKINTIGKAAFENCWYIEKIYTLDRTPPILNVDDNDYHTKMLDDIKTTFQNGWYLFGELYTYKTATLWVPESSLDEYKNHTDWGQFVNIQAFDPNTFNPSTLGIKTITNYEEEMNRYSIDGRKLSMPTKGVNIIRMKNGTVKKVLMK